MAPLISCLPQSFGKFPHFLMAFISAKWPTVLTFPQVCGDLFTVWQTRSPLYIPHMPLPLVGIKYRVIVTRVSVVTLAVLQTSFRGQGCLLHPGMSFRHSSGARGCLSNIFALSVLQDRHRVKLVPFSCCPNFASWYFGCFKLEYLITGAVQCRPYQYSTVLCSTCTILRSTVQYSTAQYNTILILYSTV